MSEIEIVTDELEAARTTLESSETVLTDIPSEPAEEPAAESEVKDESETSEEKEEKAEEEQPEKEEEEAETGEEGEEEEEPEPDEKPRRKKSAQKRFNELTRKRYEAERRAEAIEAENAELRRKLAEAEKPEDNPPKQDDFEEYEDYLKALTQYEVRKAIPQPDKESEPNAKQPEPQPQGPDLNEFKTKILEQGKKYEDFEAVAFRKELPVTEEMVKVIAETEYPAEVLYALGKDPELTAELAMSTPTQMALAIGAMDREPPQPKPKKQSKAPTPITPLQGGGSVTTKDPEKMSHEEYRKWRSGS